MARRGRGQFQFTVTELAVLAASFTVTSVLVFFLGLYVGRDLAAQHRGPDERVARIPVSENPPSLPPPLTIAGDEAEAALPEAGDDRTAHAATKPQPTASLPRPSKPAPATPPEVATRAGAPTGDRVPGALPAGILPSREASVSPSPTAEAVRDAPLQVGVPYTVQVLATRNRKEAEALAADLKRQGYGAFLTPVEDTGGKWYRVRIGRYDDPQSARSMADRCKRELGLSQAYVSPF